MTAVGATGLPILMDTFVRLTKSGVVSIAKIRGCVRGVSSEFVLACDIRFASLENTRLANLKSAWECIPAAAVTATLGGTRPSCEMPLGKMKCSGANSKTSLLQNQIQNAASISMCRSAVTQISTDALFGERCPGPFP
jgi:hypothetical protein